MTASKGTSRPNAKYIVQGERTAGIARNITYLAHLNSQRVACKVCGLKIMPKAMHVHMDIVHGEGE